MTVGRILLILVSVLVAAGACQRVLDRLRLTDRQALFFVGLIFIGGLLPDIPLGNSVRVNAGGALVPLLLAAYVWIRAGSARERLRSLAATLVTAAAVFAIGRFFPEEPEAMPFDVNYLYGIAAGLIAYAFGRSRRGAFIAGVWGMILADVLQAALLRRAGVVQTLYLGSGGLMDAVVISGVLAVLAAELTGEFLERVKQGAKRREAR